MTLSIWSAHRLGLGSVKLRDIFYLEKVSINFTLRKAKVREQPMGLLLQPFQRLEPVGAEQGGGIRRGG